MWKIVENDEQNPEKQESGTGEGGSGKTGKTALLSPTNFRKKKKASCISKKPIQKNYLFEPDTESR